MLTQNSQPKFDFKTRQSSQIDFNSLRPPRHPQVENQIELHRTQKPLLQKRYKISSEDQEQRNNKISLPSLQNLKKVELSSLDNYIKPMSLLNQGNVVKLPSRLPKLETKSDASKSKYEAQFNITPREDEQPKIKQKKISFTPEQKNENIDKDNNQNNNSLHQLKKGIQIQKQLLGMPLIMKTKAGCQVNKVTKTNQDAAIINSLNIDSQNYGLVGICDGHGVNGHFVSDLIKQRLPTFIEFQLQSMNPDMEDCFKNAFELTNNEILQSSFDTQLSGSTTVVALICKNQLWTANVGDSRAILCRNYNGWKSIQITRDHKPTDESEKQRIIQAGGRISCQKDYFGNNLGPERVWLSYIDAPGLAMTRSMGDKIGAQAGVSSIPEVFQYTLTQYDKFLVIASDGVWEYLSNDEIMSFLIPFIEMNELDQAGERLLNESINAWKINSPARDDITFIIVQLKISQ